MERISSSAHFLAAASPDLALASGAEYFDVLTRHLCENLDVDIAVVGKLGIGGGMIESVAVHGHGTSQPPLTYNLHGSPCEKVLTNRIGGYPSDVRTVFPSFELFDHLGAEAYVGIALHDANARPLGLLALIHTKPLPDVLPYQAVLSAIATRTAAELTKLHEAQELRLYQGIVSSARDLISFVDSNYRYRAINPAYTHLFQRPESEIVGRHVSELHGKDAFENDIKPRLDRALAGEASRRQRWLDLGGNDVRYVDTTYAPHVGANGEWPGIIIVMRDISETKRVEQEKLRLEGELRQSQKMDALGQFTGGVAHEFNNLLAMLLGYCQLLSRNATIKKNETLREYVLHINRAGERARSVVDELLRFSRREPVTVEPTDLENLLNTTRSMLGPVLPTSIRFQTSVDGTAPLIGADGPQLQQALVNLCLNARDAMQGTGELSLTLRAPARVSGLCSSCGQAFDGTYAAYVVRDSGPGIPAETRAQVFEPFFTTKPVGLGSGMGLAVVHGIIHEHHGHILLDASSANVPSIELAPEGMIPGSSFSGTEIELLLPLTLTQGEPPASEDLAPDDPTPETTVLDPEQTIKKSATVLVVDDELLIRMLLMEVLTRRGYEAVAAKSGAEALQILDEDGGGAIRAIICDQTMPELLGTELLALARQRGYSQPFVLCSGYSKGLDEARALSLGANAFLSKPLDIDTVGQVIDDLISEQTRAP